MKYMLLIYMSENAMGETEREQCYKDSAQLAQDLQANGQYLSANPLQPVAMATSVSVLCTVQSFESRMRTHRVREGKRLMTDGPFAETREQLGGYSSLMPRTSTRQSASPKKFLPREREPSKCGR